MKTKHLFFALFIFALSAHVFGQEELPPPPPPKFDWQMDKQDEKVYLESIDDYLRAALKEIKEYDSNKYRMLLPEVYFKSLDFPFASERNKEMRELQKKILDLEVYSESIAAKYEKATASEKSKLKKDLQKNLEKLFDLKEKSKHKEVEELERELQELRKSLKKRAQNKDKIIERRMLELLGEDDYLEW